MPVQLQQTDRFRSISTWSRSRLYINCVHSALRRTVSVSLLVAIGNWLQVAVVIRRQCSVSTDTTNDAGKFILQPAEQGMRVSVHALRHSCTAAHQTQSSTCAQTHFWFQHCINCLLADAALVLNGHFPVGQTSSKGFRQLATEQYFLCLHLQTTASMFLLYKPMSHN